MTFGKYEPAKIQKVIYVENNMSASPLEFNAAPPNANIVWEDIVQKTTRHAELVDRYVIIVEMVS